MTIIDVYEHDGQVRVSSENGRPEEGLYVNLDTAKRLRDALWIMESHASVVSSNFGREVRDLLEETKELAE